MIDQNELRAASKEWRRLLILALFLLILFCAIIAQFYRVQIVEGRGWQTKASAQHEMTVIEPFKRGRFFTTSCLKQPHVKRNLPLVFDLKSHHLYADPFHLPPRCQERLAKELAFFLSLNQEGRARIFRQLKKKSRSQKLKAHLTKEMRGKIEKWWRLFASKEKLSLRALYWVEDYHRSYPYGALLGAVLGAVQGERDLLTRQNVPTGGLEWVFDEQLKGKAGKHRLRRSPRQALETKKGETLAEHGKDIYLTIDPYIQAIAEEEIKVAVEKVKAKGGWAVMININSGEIYALAQYPSFDPSRYRSYYNDPLFNYTEVKAATDCFEPGSTFKPLNFAIALLANRECLKRGERALFNPAEMMVCHPGIFPGRKKQLFDVGGPHFFLNLPLAVQKSSCVYVAEVTKRVINHFGAAWYRKQLVDLFKLTKKTGVELPGEAVGFLPHPRKRGQWSAATPCSLSMGYNVLVNTFQLLRAHAILLTGKELSLTLIKKIGSDGEGASRSPIERKPLIDPAISRELIDALKLTTKLGGTSLRAAIPGYSAAGKSGTAEKVIDGRYAKQCHFASFIGFTPADRPQFLLFIGIDEPIYRLPGIGRVCFGGFCAAPAFKQIMQRTLDYLGVAPDDPYGYLPGDPRSDLTKAVGFKESNWQRELYKQWNGR